MDFIINEQECNEAKFEYYLTDQLDIKSITLKSITFYNSWWTGDFLPEGVRIFSFLVEITRITTHEPLDKQLWCRTLFAPGLETDTLEKEVMKICERHLENDSTTTKDTITQYTFPYSRHFSLSEFCEVWQKYIKEIGISHVKIYCDNNNYITLELTEDKEYPLKVDKLDKNEKIKIERNTEGFQISKTIREVIEKQLTVVNEWFGFKQTKFTKKGKYYSTRPLNFYRKYLFLQANLVDKAKTLYNNKPSNIFCIIPVEDGDQIKMQRYEPNCKKTINKCTNHIKFEITDENGKLVNFRGTEVSLELRIELCSQDEV